MKKPIPHMRSPIIDTSAVDIHIMGFHTEQWETDRAPISKAHSPIYTIHYVLSGIMNVELNGETHSLSDDSLFVHFPDAPAVLYPDPDEPCAIAWITLDGLKVSQYLSRLGLVEKKPILKLWKDEKIRTIFLDAPNQIRENRSISDFIGLEYFYGILKHVSFQLSHLNSESLQNIKERHVAHAINFINSSYQNHELNLEMVADAVGLTPTYLSIIFKQITGNNFTNYLFNKRLTAALSLIDDGNTHVADIAYKCGFNCQYYFSNQFKKYNLISPKKLILQRMQARKKP